MLELLFQTNNF